MPLILAPTESTVPFEALLPFVIPHVTSCPPEVAIHNIRQATIELCQRAMCWRDYQGTVYTTGDRTDFDYLVTAERRVHKLLAVYLDGEAVSVASPEAGMLAASQECTTEYAFGGLTGFELHPVQEAGKAIATYSALCPSLTADKVPESFERWFDVIADGALARLYGLAKAGWADKVEADTRRRRFESRLASIARAAARGQGKPTRSKASRYF